MRKFITALKHAWLIFISYYKYLPSDEITADLYERHLDARRRNPEFREFSERAAKDLAAAGHISADWLNNYIPTIVPEEEIWGIIDELKTKTRGCK